MAYVKTVWQDGDIILPEKLNNMEDGIEANDQKQAVLYSAQTLTDAQKAQARENIGIGGGASFDDLFPVGAFWWSTVAGSPAAQGLSAGTWEQIQDRFILSAGDDYISGATGGEPAHTLTENEMPSHRHPTRAYSAQGTATGTYWTQGWGNGSGSAANLANTDYVGGGQAHNNMPPYLAAYCWHRVA